MSRTKQTGGPRTLRAPVWHSILPQGWSADWQSTIRSTLSGPAPSCGTAAV